MARNKYGMPKVVQNDLQQCINSFRRMKKGGIGIADECVEQTCKNALKYINELEAKLENSVEVVRCKDCKYAKFYDCKNDPCYKRVLCDLDFTDGDEFFYCSKGERKDGEPND